MQLPSQLDFDLSTCFLLSSGYGRVQVGSLDRGRTPGPHDCVCRSRSGCKTWLFLFIGNPFFVGVLSRSARLCGVFSLGPPSFGNWKPALYIHPKGTSKPFMRPLLWKLPYTMYSIPYTKYSISYTVCHLGRLIFGSPHMGRLQALGVVGASSQRCTPSPLRGAWSHHSGARNCIHRQRDK